MMRRSPLVLLRSPVVRAGFLLVAFAAAVVAIASRGEGIVRALADMSALAVVGSAVLGFAYMMVTMFAWRAVLRDLGSPVPLRDASHMFFVSQVGKYLPGGLWNILAAAEMGVDRKIARRTSVSAMGVALLVSIVTGLALADLLVLFAPEPVSARYGWALWALPLLAVSLVPAVLNRLLGLFLGLLRRPPLAHPVTGAGVAAAGGWSLLAWLLAGCHVWLLATAAGLDASPQTLALATSGYALAWAVGFLVVIVPAGLGAREVVLAAVLGNQLGQSGVVLVVILSRMLLTFVDIALGLTALLLGRRRLTKERRVPTR